jgi:hypothetical protein
VASTTGTPSSLSGESSTSDELTATLMPPNPKVQGKNKRQRESSTPFSELKQSLFKKVGNAASFLTPSCKVLFSNDMACDTPKHLSPAL